MTVKIGLAKGGSATHDGHEYWFCNPKCREKFIADPVMYLERAAANGRGCNPPAPVSRRPRQCARRSTRARCIPRSASRARAIARSAAWRSSRRMPSLDDAPNPELVDMTRRFWISVALACRCSCSRWATCSSAFTPIAPRTRHRGSSSRSRRRSSSGAAAPFFVRGWRLARQPQPQHVHADRARHRRGVRLQPARDARARAVPATMRDHDGSVPVYFEAAAVISALVLLGQVLELRARSATVAARSARCSASRRRPRAGSRATAAKRTSRSS